MRNERQHRRSKRVANTSPIIHPKTDLPPNPIQLEHNIRDIARDLNRLRPDWRDAERFYIEREGLVRRLYSLATTAEGIR